MPDLADSVFDRAMALTPDQRERLAERLLRSTDDQAIGEIGGAWIAEADRRYTEWKRDEGKE